jgi:S-DNA-T family DNA segregation ATPase FtsK/SpoIIIE
MRYAFAHADKINSDITLGRGVKADASKITKEGQFIYRDKKALKKFEVLQSPYLPPDDEKNIKGAKSILEPFKVPFIKEDGNNNVINEALVHDVSEYEKPKKLTKSDIFGRL